MERGFYCEDVGRVQDLWRVEERRPKTLLLQRAHAASQRQTASITRMLKRHATHDDEAPPSDRPQGHGSTPTSPSEADASSWTALANDLLQTPPSATVPSDCCLYSSWVVRNYCQQSGDASYNHRMGALNEELRRYHSMELDNEDYDETKVEEAQDSMHEGYVTALNAWQERISAAAALRQARAKLGRSRSADEVAARTSRKPHVGVQQRKLKSNRKSRRTLGMSDGKSEGEFQDEQDETQNESEEEEEEQCARTARGGKRSSPNGDTATPVPRSRRCGTAQAQQRRTATAADRRQAHRVPSGASAGNRDKRQVLDCVLT